MFEHANFKHIYREINFKADELAMLEKKFKVDFRIYLSFTGLKELIHIIFFECMRGLVVLKAVILDIKSVLLTWSRTWF